MLATGLVHSQISIRTSVEIGAFQSPILPIYVVRADKSHVDHMATQNASHYPRRWFLFETPDRSANLGPNILKEKQYRLSQTRSGAGNNPSLSLRRRICTHAQ